MRIKRPETTVGAGHNLSAVVETKPEDLRAIEGHPRTYTSADIERAIPFVQRHRDCVFPIFVNDENQVIIGGIFLEAARKARLSTLRVIRQSGLPETEALLMGTAIAQLQTLGDWDGPALEEALRLFESQIEDFSPDILGLAPGELDRIIGASTFGPGADVVPPLAQQPVSSPGMLWGCGPHHVLCGDATDPAAIQVLLAGEQVSVALCDPPFGCKIDGFVSKKGKHSNFVQGAGDMDDTQLHGFFERFCRAIAAVLKPGALVYLFIDWRSLAILQAAAEAVFGKLVNLCVWAKDRAGMGSFYRSQHELILVFTMPGTPHRNNIELGKHGRNRSNVWSFPAAASIRKGREGDMLRKHPTPKPVEMLAEAIIDSSVRGEIVADVFLGSGATLIAAERTGRVFRGMDLDPLYVDLAVRRWQDWTGKDAIELASGRTFNEIAVEMDDGEETR